MSTKTNQEEKKVKLGDHPFLTSLTEHSMVYEGESLDKVITVVAVEGYHDDWAAYFETPWTGLPVAEYGNKLPEEVAAALFPEWAKRLKWRA